jgi:acyl-CoA synthetase (AMP-forming)/AMP-acid ligase II
MCIPFSKLQLRSC